MEQIEKNTKRIFYLDVLRAIAILAVIMSHVFNEAYGLIAKEYSSLSFGWIMTNFAYCFSRWGVALFLVISGALLLGKNEDFRLFLSKRIPRIAIPFLFWGCVLSSFLILISYFKPSLIEVISSFDIWTIFTYLINSYIFVNHGFGPYWFFWMILAVYLTMPIINKFLLNSNLKKVEYFLLIWGVICLFEDTLFVYFPITLNFLICPIGFVVLGYYLINTERKLFNNPYFGLFLCLSVYFLSVALNFIFSTNKSFFNINAYSIIVILEVIGVFIFAKNFDKMNLPISSDNVFGKAISSLAIYSYGIYLTHRVFLIIFVGMYMYKFIPYPRLFLMLYLRTLFVSWILLMVLNRVPYVKEVIGVK